jgi:hypothetical protein
MQTNGKYIIQATGPLLTYRLELLREACPVAKDFLLVLTNQFSYDNLFKDFHDSFTFVIMDDYRKNHPISLEYEIFPEFMSEEEFLKNVHTFYGNSTGKFYPYDIHRFIFPYLIENKILNFALVDADFIMVNDFNVLNDFFTHIPPGTVYGPWHGEDAYAREFKETFWKKLQPNFTEIKLESPFLRTVDGWMRGFNFRNFEEMELLYNIWNSSLYEGFIKKENNLTLYGQHARIILGTEWIISHIMQFFEHNLGYGFHDCYNFMNVKNHNIEIGRHYTRIEDTIYAGPRDCWSHFNFDYSDTTTISAFIKNNKDSLKKYYEGTFKNINITDNFVYTNFK